MTARPRAGSAAISLTEFAVDNTVALNRFAYLICGDRGLAEDLVQDAFLQLYRRFGERLTVEAPVAYARKVIVNGSLTRLRRRASHETVLAELPDSPAPESETAAQTATWHALALLPQRQRAVMVLRYYLDLPDREIATLLGCREGSVRSLAARAFAALRTVPELHSREDYR